MGLSGDNQSWRWAVDCQKMNSINKIEQSLILIERSELLTFQRCILKHIDPVRWRLLEAVGDVSVGWVTVTLPRGTRTTSRSVTVHSLPH